MTRARGFRGARSGAVHNKEWTAACIDGTSMDNAIGTLLAFTMFVADEAETILRSRGHIWAVLNAGAQDEEVTLAVGLGIVTARAATTTATVPRPSTDGSFPWLWHGWLHVSNFAASFATAGSSQAAMSDSIIVDSKAMRKVKETEVMILAFEVCESDDKTGSTSLGAGFRVLTGD